MACENCTTVCVRLSFEPVQLSPIPPFTCSPPTGTLSLPTHKKTRRMNSHDGWYHMPATPPHFPASLSPQDELMSCVFFFYFIFSFQTGRMAMLAPPPPTSTPLTPNHCHSHPAPAQPAPLTGVVTTGTTSSYPPCMTGLHLPCTKVRTLTMLISSPWGIALLTLVSKSM